MTDQALPGTAPSQNTTRKPKQARTAAGEPEGDAVGAAAWRDLAVLLLLAVTGIIGFAPAFADGVFLVAGIGGILVGACAGYLSRLWRLNAFVTVMLAVVAYVVVGTPLAVPSQGLFAVLPTLDSLRSLALGSVFGWTDIVTLPAPVAQPDYIDVLPYACGWLVGLVSAVLALRWMPRRERGTLAASVLLVAPFVLYLLGVLVGTSQPFLAVVRGVALALIALIWLGWRRGDNRNAALQDRGRLRRTRLVGSGIIAVAALLVAGVTGSVLAPSSDARFVLRDEIVPPFDPTDYPSPLSGFREYTKDLAETELFTVSGLEAGDLIRLATMDTYNGRLWNLAGPETAADGSGSFTLVGEDLPEPWLLSSSESRSIDVTVIDYSGVWLPLAGHPKSLTLPAEPDASQDLRYNPATATAVVTSGVSSGYRYSFDTALQDQPSDDELLTVPVASVQMPPVHTVPDIVAAKSAEYVGEATTPIEQLRAVETALHNNGFLSHGLASDNVPSRAGHGADRIDELFTRNQMIGDEEQFAAAFALIARELGYPARVVMGFAPEDADGGAPITVTGEAVTAWVEVPFEDVGWIPFFPTPDEKEIPQDQTPKPKTEPQPQVRQPPRAAQQDDDLLTNVEIDDKDEDENNDRAGIPLWVWIVLAAVGIPVLLCILPALIVALVKRRRVAKRRRGGASHQQAAGAWDELVDRHAELGFAVPARVTRRNIARGLAAQYETPNEPDGRRMPDGLLEFAEDTDRAVFAGHEVPDDDVESLWRRTDEQSSHATSAVGWWRRQLRRFRVSGTRTLADRLSAPAPKRERAEGRSSNG
ncbi:transglutaminase-like domain-containing protein [Okibacterium endophyticum]